MLSLLGKIWHSRGTFDPHQSLFENFCRIRNISEDDIAPAKFEEIADPFLFRDMQKSVNRILHALEKKQKICIFGDYDADGITGTALLFLTLRYFEADVSYMLPSREDGYGFSQKFAEQIASEKTDLLITTDCGITSADSVKYLQEGDIDVIITDHHAPPKQLPPAYAVLHPLLPNETFSDTDLTGAGVAFFLSLALLYSRLGKEKSKTIANQLLELAVIGTIADCGIMKGQNRILTVLGIEALQTTKNKGLLQLMELANIDTKHITHESIAYYLAPRINVAGRLDHPHKALEVLLGNPQNAEYLESLNSERQEIVIEFITQAEQMLEKDAQNISIILKSSKWPSGVIGLIAGKLQEKYNRPTIVIEEKADKLVASCRGPENFHFIEALTSITHTETDMFLGFGGHSVAAGFSLLPEKFDVFVELFNVEVQKKLGNTMESPQVCFDGHVETEITTKDISELSRARPFGNGNASPLFCFPKAEVQNIRHVGSDKKHLSLWIRSPSGQFFSGIFFAQGSHYNTLMEKKIWDILATPEINIWKGEERLQLKIVDMSSETSSSDTE